MSEEMKQKRDELAEENYPLENAGHLSDSAYYERAGGHDGFKEGFDACYKLMEAENAHLRVMNNATNPNWPHEKKLHETITELKSRIDWLEKCEKQSEISLKETVKENVAMRNKVKHLEANNSELKEVIKELSESMTAISDLSSHMKLAASLFAFKDGKITIPKSEVTK